MILKEFNTKITTKEVICDVEIGNELAPEWIYENADIVTFGILNGNKAIILQREKKDDVGTFKTAIKDILKDIPHFYSFNVNMEKKGLYGFLSENYSVKEIKLWSGRGWSKNLFFEEISKIVKIEDEINCPFDGDSSKTQEAYNNEKYEDIISHNLTCLLKEAYIKKYGDKLIEKYKDQIGEDGWIKDDKNTNNNSNWKDQPASVRQLQYLIKLGCKKIPKTKGEASKLIDEYK